MNDTNFDILKRIEELCTIKGWTVYKLASMSGISYSNLNNIINRGTQPTVPTIEKICSGFNISLSEFFTSDTPPLINGNELSATEREILDTYRALNRNKKKQLQSYLNGLSEK